MVNFKDEQEFRAYFPFPEELKSCHRVIIGNYFVEGHVPVEAIAKLLARKPNIDGITLPEMPAGSPGMDGERTEPLTILAVSGGRVSTFMTIP